MSDTGRGGIVETASSTDTASPSSPSSPDDRVPLPSDPLPNADGREGGGGGRRRARPPRGDRSRASDGGRRIAWAHPSGGEWQRGVLLPFRQSMRYRRRAPRPRPRPPAPGRGRVRSVVCPLPRVQMSVPQTRHESVTEISVRRSHSHSLRNFPQKSNGDGRKRREENEENKKQEQERRASLLSRVIRSKRSAVRLPLCRSMMAAAHSNGDDDDAVVLHLPLQPIQQ